MAGITLRDYQNEAISKIIEAAEKGVTETAVMLPTGTGKAVIQAALAAKFKGGRSAILVPFEHLIYSAVEKLRFFFDADDIGVVQAENDITNRPVSVISVQTILSERRLSPLRGKMGLVIADEMPYFLAPKFNAAMNALRAKESLLSGWSATILRSDRVGLKAAFGELVYHKSLWEMIGAGWLADLKGIRIDAQIDFSQVPMEGDDFSDEGLEKVMNTEQCMELLYYGWLKHAKDRVTIGFTPTVFMAKQMAEFWAERGVRADWVSGQMSKERVKIVLDGYRSGEVQCVFCCSKLAVGFDHPPISCILLARPTRSQSFLIQMIGRGSRICRDDIYRECTRPIADIVQPRKTDCLVIDAGGVSDLGLEQFPGLFELPGEVIEKLKRQQREKPDEPISYMETMKAHKVEARGLCIQNVDLRQSSSYNWLKTRYGWTLELGKNGKVDLIRDGDGYAVHAKAGGVSEVLHAYPLTFDWALATADQWAQKQLRGKKQSERGMAKQNAKWRTQEMTEPQFYKLKQLKIMPVCLYRDYWDYRMKAKQVLTRGEAGDLITARFADLNFKGK